MFWREMQGSRWRWFLDMLRSELPGKKNKRAKRSFMEVEEEDMRMVSMQER